MIKNAIGQVSMCISGRQYFGGWGKEIWKGVETMWHMLDIPILVM